MKILRGLLVLPLLFLAGACGGPQTPSGGGSTLINDTAVGKSRCEDAKTHQLKPFIVEWDATDLAGFEAKAARDVVFVKYEGCSLTVLDGCSDSSIPGRYGKYNPPQFTSGNVEGIDIKNEDQLYANLPLGVASFGAHVSQGEALKLQYYITGVATATRDTIPQSDLAKNPECADATHFVWAYDLGAFELSSDKATTAGGSVGVGNIGGGAEHKHDQQNLKHGGDLESCKTESQLNCRVPIRLALRKIGVGGAELGDKANSAAPPPPPVIDNTPEGQARALRSSAKEKEQRAGDGVGCLADLDRADRIDPNGSHAMDVMYTRAMCLMRAGKCDEGKKLHTEFMKATDKDHNMSDAQIEASTKAMADAKCPSSSGGTPDEQARRAMARVAEATQKKNADACLEEAKKMEKLAPSLKDVNQRNMANGVLMQAAMCAGAAGRCDDAKKLWDRYYELQFGGTMKPADLKKTAAQTFAASVRDCAKK